MYTKEDDIRRNSYSANIGVTTFSSVATDWGHTYNDVQVPYNTLTGFSIRAQRKQMAANALIRLPKADEMYDYYDWADASSDPASGTNVKKVTPKTDANRFVTDDAIKAVDGAVDGAARDGEMSFTISSLQQIGDYVLIGNPYMCSLNMQKFFDVNSSLERGYWTYEASVASAQLTDGYVKPTQAFFVKKGSATTITFSRAMQIDGNYPTLSSGARVMDRSVTLAMANGLSQALVVVSDTASADYVSSEDVETLFDSNLSDVPMVFTVAGRQAVSIDVRPEIGIVPFGVSCGSSDELVEVTLSGADIAEGPLYVVDGVTGNITEVGEGSTFSVQPNDYGRYFLTTRGDLTGIGETRTSGIVVSVRGHEVTVKSGGEPLTAVRTLTAGGTTVNSLQPAEAQVSFQLQGGVYIIEAQTAEAKRTMKVIVK